MHTTGDECGAMTVGGSRDAKSREIAVDLSRDESNGGPLTGRQVVRVYERRPCSCLQEGTECKCGTGSKSKLSVRLEPWAGYKTFLMSSLLVVMVVWVVIFVTLMWRSSF
ncbi:uncharacterized protein LOC111613635 [Centruroides sculpturatus]|uniref:uncharacterized protein LOC111613635 n=1 Tax=Centruroides sculpturatus TaxID=218467 RepID=UPI000C6CDE06|nr:uncharacterized protein LOC111613635 [Centruroides sculpturatus]